MWDNKLVSLPSCGTTVPVGPGLPHMPAAPVPKYPSQARLDPADEHEGGGPDLPGAPASTRCLIINSTRLNHLVTAGRWVPGAVGPPWLRRARRRTTRTPLAPHPRHLRAASPACTPGCRSPGAGSARPRPPSCRSRAPKCDGRSQSNARCECGTPASSSENSVGLKQELLGQLEG